MVVYTYIKFDDVTIRKVLDQDIWIVNSLSVSALVAI